MLSDSIPYSVPFLYRRTTELNQFLRGKTRKLVLDILLEGFNSKSIIYLWIQFCSSSLYRGEPNHNV